MLMAIVNRYLKTSAKQEWNDFLVDMVHAFIRRFGYPPDRITIRAQQDTKLRKVKVGKLVIPVSKSSTLLPNYADMSPVGLKRKAVKFEGERQPVV